ncbi:MAG: T9SS type A sorting domain-containing protein, partial [Bacteroidota bacterium]
KMYWSELNEDAVGIIKRANLDGSGVEDLIVLPGIEGPREIELDIAGGKIYWLNVARNNSSSKIQRANLDGSGIETLYSRNDGDMNGLALDLEAGKIYWTYNPAGTEQDRLRRANLNGSGVEDLPINVFNPLDISILPASASSGPNFTENQGSTSTPSGISITNGISMEVFPNPTKQLLNVEVEGLAAAKVDLVVYDLQGRRVFSQTLFTDTPVLRQQLDLRDLSEGVYSLLLLNNDQQVIKRFQMVK